MSRRPRPAALAVLACAASIVASTAALAHDTWLLASRAVVPPGVDVVFDMTSGMAFPAPETAIRPERVRVARLRLAGATEPLPRPAAAARTLRFRTPLRRAGVATAWVSLAPRELAMDSADVVHYLDEIGAPDSVRTAYLRQLPVDGKRRWRERYVKHAVAFVRASSPMRPAPAGDSSWAAPLGLALELVPERDPTALRVGDTLVVRLLRRGAPAVGVAVGLVGGGRTTGPTARTDAEGRVRLAVPRPGRWMARATDLRRATDAGADWESDFTTLTFATR